MSSFDESFVDAAAPTVESAKNGRALMLKGKLAELHLSEDGTLLFGDCQGSGRTAYLCSADFATSDKPVYRCTCPSRLFPCKHTLGLMYARVEGHPFTVAEVPAELAAKREKAQARQEKTKTDPQKPRTVNKSALSKKIKAQLEGIDLLEKITRDLVRLGIGNMNAKIAHEIEEQAKQLGNAYLTGAQSALRSYTTLFYDADSRQERSTQQRESIYSEALDQLGRLHALASKGRAYLQRRLEDPQLAPDIDTPIAAWLGHAWQLRELKEVGLVEPQVELVQLAFHSHDDVARQEIIDTGVWIQLNNGRIVCTRTLRPYKALKFIRSEDSFFQVANVAELYRYPGDLNPRVRWEGMTSRPIEPNDLATIRGSARADFAEVIKEVKQHLKAPLSDKHPIFLLRFRQLGQIDGKYVVEDARGERLVLTDAGMHEEPRSCHLLPFLPEPALTDQALVARFRHDLDTRTLCVKPLSIVTATELIRLTL